MKPLRDLLSFCTFTVKQIEAFCTAVLVESYEPRTDDGLGIPGVHAIPEKGYVSGGLRVHDEQLHKIYEDMVTELAQFFEYFKAKYTKRLWRLAELEKRICETCGVSFNGNESQVECYVCRRGE